jgi:hypothetical protein
MYEKLLNTPYVKADIEKEKSIFVVIVKPQSRELNDEQLQVIILEVIDLIKSIRPKYYISDQTDMEVVFPVILQEWIADIFGQAFIEIGLKKYAYVKPKELIADLSMEQTFDELTKNSLPFQVNYFSSLEEAINWVRED